MNDIIKAHEHSIRHKKELLESHICGSFYCCKIFSPQEIIEWTADGYNKTNSVVPILWDRFNYWR
jgi:hypothetical protein